MLGCKDATHLLSEGQDRTLSVPERVQLKMHLAICSGCRNFGKQMDLLRAACQRLKPGRNDPESQ